MELPVSSGQHRLYIVLRSTRSSSPSQDVICKTLSARVAGVVVTAFKNNPPGRGRK
jgi:hypothetical protein